MHELIDFNRYKRKDEVMSKKQEVKDLILNTSFDDNFIVKDAEFRVRRDKKTVDMFFKIGDRSGDMLAIIWDVSKERMEKYENIKFARVQGHVTKKMANGVLQATVSSIIKTTPLNFSDYLPHSKRDLEKMMGVIYLKIESIHNVHLKSLLSSFFEESEFVDKFKRAPAATKVHQPYIGGLLEHTYNLVKICESLCDIYTEIDHDFLITLALLHDIGKVREYSYDNSIDYTDEGKLLGHIAIGFEMIDQKLKDLKNFPEDLAVLIKHAILSHHGHFEYGSPKLPSTLTTIALHYADEVEAKISGFLNIKDEENQLNGKWSKRIWWLDRAVYLGEEESLKENFKEK